MNNLWQKNPLENGILVDIFKNIGPSSISIDTEFEKNSDTSTRMRGLGNDIFRKNNYFEAMEYYNSSLRWAESGTKNETLAYSNRSACFLHLKMYQKCLTDIDMALAMQENISKELQLKLMKRKTECIKLMKHDKQEQPIKRNLCSGANKNFPCLADVATIQHNEEFGRHVVANCDIPVGKAILIEESFLSTTLWGISACATCQKTRMNFIACEHCSLAIFCDEECKRNNYLHQYDCGVNYDKIETENGELQMIAQSVFFAMDALKSVDKLIDFVFRVRKNAPNWMPKSIADAQSKYELFLMLCAPVDGHQEFFIKAKKLYTILLKLPTISSYFKSEAEKRFLMHLVTNHIFIIKKNSIVSTQNKCQRIVTLGLVFPLFNHECSPNLLNFSVGNRQICMTLRPVRKGDQLFVSYICADIPTRMSQQYLMQNFGFLCKCDKCVPKSQPDNVARLITDPSYKFLQLNIKSDLMVQKIRLNIKEKCIILLNKYGHVWSPQLQFVLDVYIKTEMYEH